MLGYLISPVLQVENTDGKPLVGGRIVVYRHGTTEPYITYKDFEGTHNPAEVILDSKGMAILIAEEGYSYDVYCRDRNYVEQWSRIGISIGQGTGGYIYTAGDGIEIKNYSISVKYGNGIELDANNKLQTKLGNGLLFDGDNVEVSVGEGIHFDSNGKLTTELPDDWTDITNEWIFLNGFRLQYNGDTPGFGNDMSILYSKMRKLVKFTGSMRVNTISSFNDLSWHGFLRYEGTKFYTSHNAPDSASAPKIHPMQIGGIAYAPATNSNGGTVNALMKLSYVGSPNNVIDDCALAMQIFVPSNISVYGAVMEGLQLSVTPIE